MEIEFKPIGFVQTDVATVPRHWSISDVEGMIVIDKIYTDGLKYIKIGENIIVIFHFHQSKEFDLHHLIQKPPHRNEKLGVFSSCSPVRPNPIGMSVLEVSGIEGNVIHVKGLDMVDGTPILDIKPMAGLKRDSA
ncbi:MAG: tRNA (N6-threonylcarbamoyladenosine(37)-N6)-methyltransferase TrmO [Nitrospirae bacterium]|nr:tRNA (N6-threonylcarbamoyladenosine(37)-N6)-methyltransferase TrmO [Nitrospirota bacterium]